MRGSIADAYRFPSPMFTNKPLLRSYEIRPNAASRVRSILLLAWLIGFLCGQAHAAKVADWVADNYTSGNWVSTSGATISASPVNAPVVVANAFGSHKGINFSGGRYFIVAAGSNPIAGKTSFTVAAVFKATSAGAGAGNWYNGSGLVGGEQGGVTNDFGLGWSSGSAAIGGAGFSGNSDYTITSASQTLNAIHAAVLTYDGTTGKLTLFVDGTQVGTPTNVPSNAARNSSAFGLGAMTGTGGNPFPGLVADLQMYDTVEDGVALSNSLKAAFSAPPLVTSFTQDKVTAYEGDNVQFGWTINTAPITGTLSVVLKRGATTIYSGSNATGTFTTSIPDLAGAAQTFAYTLTATEVGGGGLTDSKTLSVTADPGIPIASAQGGIFVNQPAARTITLVATDPNGGALTYSIVTSPAKGTVSLAGNVATYTPAAGTIGADSFTFKVSDGKYNSAPAKVSVILNPPAAAPTGIALDNTVVFTAATTGAFIANILSTDANVNDAHTFTLVAGTGSTDNARFSIIGHQLRAAQSFAALAGQTFAIRLRSTDSGGLFFEQSLTLSCAASARGIVINEIHYNGGNNASLNEFIELYNAGTTTVNMTGWRLSSAVDFNFPSGTTLAPGAYLLIAQSPSTIQTLYGKVALGPWIGSLSSSGENVRLRNAADAVISQVDYKPNFPWPSAADGDGASIELINPQLDETIGGNWRASAFPVTGADVVSPGAQNLQFSTNAPPATRQVALSPAQPTSGDAIVVTAKVTDPDGVATVVLKYQIVAPGSFIPSTLPKAISGGQFVNVNAPLAANPAFEDPANWVTIPMNDDGIGADAQGGDSIYTATIPIQAKRTLIRYRIVVTDNPGASVRVPYADDPSLNFAAYVYDGVPDYQGTPSSTLTSLPTYHFLTRSGDWDQCVAFSAADQLTPATVSWTFENWEAAFVYEGVVHDHIQYRLHGANGRYSASGSPGAAATSKRAFKFIFNKGAYLQARDNDGINYPTTWKTMITENLWENRGTYTFSLNEALNFYVWNQLGVPAPFANFAHFRTVKQSAEQPDQWHGDFWGLMFVHEDYDGRFLDSHNLPKGNLYKLTKDTAVGVSQQRYQAAGAPTNGSDHDDIKNTLNGYSTEAFITGRVNVDLWSRYHAFAEAIRHYDYWPSGDNNAAYYFYPDYNAANNSKGVLWYFPNDVDATWGPTWNNGRDIVHNSIFDDTIDSSGSRGGDNGTHPNLYPRYYAQVREIRDLLWQPEQINPLIDQLAAVIQPFVNADFARWYGAPADAGNFAGLAGFGQSSSVGTTSLAAYVAGMKDFAFDADNNGSTWPGGDVSTGGRAAYLDFRQAENGESAAIPATPTLTFTGPGTHPVSALDFSKSAFADPQGAATFGAVQWRIAEVNTTANYIPGTKRLLEIHAAFDTGPVANNGTTFHFPASACVPGQRYRARVRQQDSTGHWSHWSAPAEFTAAAADLYPYTSSLVISEIMYHPTPPTTAEASAGWVEDDFEYLEIRNVGPAAIDLSDVRLTKGVDFDFPAYPGNILLQPGATTLVVRNIAAFNSRYGTGKPIAGQWQAGDSLKDTGEEIKLSFGAGTPIIDFSYKNIAPWPTQPDGLGYSLVLIAPETLPNPALGENWRASRVAGGSPGGDDRFTFSSWATAHSVTGGPDADDDSDGISNRVEYALGTDPRTADRTGGPVTALTAFDIGGGQTADYLTLTFRRQIGAEDISYHVEFATTLTAWGENGTLAASTFNGDGTITELWRASIPANGAPAQFDRLRITAP